jgi:ATP-dependent DNA helicase PIF1
MNNINIFKSFEYNDINNDNDINNTKIELSKNIQTEIPPIITTKTKQLSIEQQLVFDKYLMGENVFATGPGGVGKSELIKRIYEHAISTYKSIKVCALTGCAAILLNCKAKTLHSWAGIGLGKGDLYNMIEKIKKHKKKRQLWKTTDILVIDEVSMLSLHLFELLNEIGKSVRYSKRPFGGIQIILMGDLFQLPPIYDKENIDTGKFCFESDIWNDVFPVENQIELTTNFRQNDPVWVKILNGIREGKITKKNIVLLNNIVSNPPVNNTNLIPTKLYPTKSKVNYINNNEMYKLEGDNKIFNAEKKYNLPIQFKEDQIKRNSITPEQIETELDYLKNNLICDCSISLKIGSQVMCICNIKDMNNDILLCNGSQGVIIDFIKNDITNKYMPKINFPKENIEYIMDNHIWESENIPGVGISQMPLILSWALTIHKSQGATLEIAEIDIGSDIFECGQTYVALSRLKSIEGLYLKSFDVDSICINGKVKQYYDNLRQLKK